MSHVSLPLFPFYLFVSSEFVQHSETYVLERTLVLYCDDVCKI